MYIIGKLVIKPNCTYRYKILFNTNHRKRAINVIIVGLINMPEVPWAGKMVL